jgi:hypothetical protein
MSRDFPHQETPDSLTPILGYPEASKFFLDAQHSFRSHRRRVLVNVAAVFCSFFGQADSNPFPARE